MKKISLLATLLLCSQSFSAISSSALEMDHKPNLELGINLIEPLRGKHPRILIFSPHPDDDILGNAGLMKAIQTLKSQGNDIDLRIVYMTCGDSSGLSLQKEKEKGLAKNFIELGILRHKEALDALLLLGVSSENTHFLGYPDQGLLPIFSMSPSTKNAYVSPATGQSKVSYSFAFHREALFTRNFVLEDVENIIVGFKPTAVFTPTLTDEHSDHRATREFVAEALSHLKSDIPHYEYLIHWEIIDMEWPPRGREWKTPLNHIPADISLRLSDFDWNLEEKHKIIAAHDSQTSSEGAYLYGFAKDTETFWLSRSSMKDYVVDPVSQR